MIDGACLKIDNEKVLQLYRDIDAVFMKYGCSPMERYWISWMYSTEKLSYVTMETYNNINYGAFSMKIPESSDKKIKKESYAGR